MPALKRAPAYRPDVDRLAEAVRKARITLHHPRETRANLVRMVAGNLWSEETSADKKQPLNLINLYLTIMGRNLIAKNPRVMLSTFQRQSRASVSAMQDWINDAVEDMHLAETLKRVVFDALYSVGILKVALATPSDAAMAGWNFQAGKPFAERVDLDDFVYDVHAADFREAGFIGHRYRVPLETIRDNPMYSKDRKDLEAQDDRKFNEQGDERIKVLGLGYYSHKEELEDMIDLWEIYIPRHKRLVTLASDAGGTPRTDIEPLRSVEWVGPDEGPYHFLGYEFVPGNAMPKGPVQNLADLHEAINRLYRKLVRQADRQKEVLAVGGTATTEAERVLETSDGEACRVDNVDRMKSMLFGGPFAGNIQFGNHLKDLFDFMAGGMSLLGGLAPQSKTLGQDKMLNENASASVASMQEDTTLFVGSACRALCWYWWHDPITTAKSEFQVPGVPGISVPRQVTPQQRQMVKWEDLRVKVDPYSLRGQSPQQRVAAILDIVKGVYLPMAQLAQQQGVMLDLNALFEKVGTYSDQPDLIEIIHTMTPPAEPASGGGGGGDAGTGMPQETTRNYVRRSLGNDTQANRDAGLENQLAAAGGNRNGAMNGDGRG